MQRYTHLTVLAQQQQAFVCYDTCACTQVLFRMQLCPTTMPLPSSNNHGAHQLLPAPCLLARCRQLLLAAHLLHQLCPDTRQLCLSPSMSWQAASAAAFEAASCLSSQQAVLQAASCPAPPHQATMKALSAQAWSHSRQGFCANRPAVRLSRTTDTIVLGDTSLSG